jgi:signal transduction histidine kinase
VKYILLFLLFFHTSLFSLDTEPHTIPMYKVIEVAHNLQSIDKVLEHPEKFETIKYFRRFLRKNKDSNNLWLKLPLENNTEKLIKKQLVSRWDRVNIDIYLVDKEKVVYQEKIKRKDSMFVSSPLIIPAKKSLTMYLHIKVPKQIDDFYYLYLVSPDNVQKFIVHKEKYYHNGFFFGILLTMMMYNFFMYFSIKIKSYLYLGFYQASIIFYTTDIRLFFIEIFEDFPTFSYLVFKVFSSVFISILSLVFTKEFLNTKKNMPHLNNVLNFSMLILVAFQLNIVIINYASFIYLIFIFTGLYAFYKGDKSAIFYTLGFSGFVFYIILMNLVRIFEWDIYLEYQSAMQLFSCIEALALSMALYLKIKSIVKEKEDAQQEANKNEKMLLEQSRFASMGEMIASIAHQWRQPLNHLNLILNNLRLAQRTNNLNEKYLETKTSEAERQLSYMSDTIEDFSNYFVTKGNKEQVSLTEICKLANDLLETRYKKEQISVSLNIVHDCVYVNYKNELVQVLTIILNNAIDALVTNNTQNRYITITVECNKIIIDDNAGGINEDILMKIFDPYFSTKDKKFGTGIGLYIAKILVNGLIQGKLTAVNHNNGARFSILLPNKLP